MDNRCLPVSADNPSTQVKNFRISFSKVVISERTCKITGLKLGGWCDKTFLKMKERAGFFFFFFRFIGVYTGGREGEKESQANYPHTAPPKVQSPTEDLNSQLTLRS